MNLLNKKVQKVFIMTAGALALPALWIFVKYGLGTSDRYVPSPMAVLQAVYDIQPNVWIHLTYTSMRFIIGFTMGVSTGILLALLMARNVKWKWFLMPAIQALRPVPTAAVVPFFLLWFGFSEWGRYLLVVAAIAFNIAISASEILQQTSDKYAAFFVSFKIIPGKLTLQYALPQILEHILPTIRFALALAIGAVTISEVLGSQVGLGYLIQTSRSTFSLQVLFLSAILLGVLSACADALLVIIWRRIVFWKRMV